MRSLTLFILFTITQLSLSSHYADHCRDDEDRYQNIGQGDTYIRRSTLEGEELRSRLIPKLVPSSDNNKNKNSNINVNSASSHQQPSGIGGYTEWWEIVTERSLDNARRNNPKLESHDNIKSQIQKDNSNKDVVDAVPRNEFTSNYGQSRKFLIQEAELNSMDNRKHSSTPQGVSRRSKQLLAMEKAQRSLKLQQQAALRNQKIDDNSDVSNLQNELHRKSNENVNTNVNQFSRRNMNNDEIHSRSETRKSSNTNQNVNVNDRSGGAVDDSLLELYQKLGRSGSIDSSEGFGPKSLGSMNRPIAERSHSNVNHNVNANVHSDMSHGPMNKAQPEDLRRHLFNTKHLFPRPHHPNDNHNVNININGEEPPSDDQPEDLPPPSNDQPSDVESNNAAN